MAPIVPPKYLSLTGAHDWPALIVLKTPPPVVPIQNSSGRDGLPTPATDRPPRYGPISRQRSPVKASESRCANTVVGSASAMRKLKRVTRDIDTPEKTTRGNVKNAAWREGSQLGCDSDPSQSGWRKVANPSLRLGIVAWVSRIFPQT